MVDSVDPALVIRPFCENDAENVRNLFIEVNRLLSPPHLREAFEAYIATSLEAEIDRIPAYYGERDGGFWVAVEEDRLLGMFGLESSSASAMELRRMYVAPGARRRGIARKMLQFSEGECLRRNRPVMILSTSELQHDAISLYRRAGYQLLREEIAVAGSHKTLGNGIRRFHFAKRLADQAIPGSTPPLGEGR